MNEPEIASKVKFWEEQQRINSLLIPRVAELVDSSRKMVESIQDLRRVSVAAEQRVLSRATAVEAEIRVAMKEVGRMVAAGADRDRRVSDMEVTLAKFRDSFAGWEKSVGALTSEARALVASSETRIVELESGVAETRRELKLQVAAAAKQVRIAQGIAGGAALLGLIGLFT